MCDCECCGKEYGARFKDPKDATFLNAFLDSVGYKGGDGFMAKFSKNGNGAYECSDMGLPGAPVTKSLAEISYAAELVGSNGIFGVNIIVVD